MEKVQKKLVGEAGSVVTPGFNEDQLTSDGDVVFSDLKGESLGSIKSFLFWNSLQYDCMMNPWPKIAILGEFGTGKNLLSISLPPCQTININFCLYIITIYIYY